MITVAPPVVQPSLGLMALMQGVAEIKSRKQKFPLMKQNWNLIHDN